MRTGSTVKSGTNFPGWRQGFRSGAAWAGELIADPGRGFGSKPWSSGFAVLYLVARGACLPAHALAVGPARALASLAVAAGYSWRWIAGARVAAGESTCYNPTTDGGQR